MATPAARAGGADSDATASRAGWRLTAVSSLHKLTARDRGVLEPFPTTPARLLAARDEWESFQVVITAGDQPLANLRAAMSPLTGADGDTIASAVRLFHENYVLVNQPSGNRRLERLWWPDALVPTTLRPLPPLPARRSMALWVAVHAPEDAAAGRYTGTVEVAGDGVAQRLPVSLQVEPVTVPPPSLRGNVAVYYDVLRDWYTKNLTPLAGTGLAALKRQYYEFLLDYRLNAYDLPVPWSSDGCDRYLRDPRVLSVRLPPLDSPDLPVALRRLRATGSLYKAYYYWIDEPAPEHYADVRFTKAKLHALDLSLRHCVTMHPNRSLQGAVDIWCPNIGDYFGLGHLDLARLATERQRGRETWWYTMVEPKYPYPTWLLDDDAVAVRRYGWMMARWGINGFVYSMAHGWGPHPLQSLQSFAGSNGDGTLLYPSELVNSASSGPMPSIRLMLLRDAIEDYELLSLLPPALRAGVASTVAMPSPLSQVAPLQVRDDNPLVSGQSRELLFAALAGKPLRLRPDAPNLCLAGAVPFGAIPAVAPDQRPPSIDGRLDDAAWNEQTRYRGDFTRFAGETPPLPTGTRLWMAHDTHHLLVAVRARRLSATLRGEWVAVELAPSSGAQRWRFVVTPSGHSAVERHTREGQFAVPGLSWRHANSTYPAYYNVELEIPLSVIGHPARLRLNVLRRVNDSAVNARYTVRAYPDAGDVLLMPVVTLAPWRLN